MCMFGPIKHAAMNTVPGKVRFVQHRLKRQLSKTDTATYPKKKNKKSRESCRSRRQCQG